MTQNTIMTTTHTNHQHQRLVQTFTNNRHEFQADRFQTLYNSANVRVRVMPLSVSQDSFVSRTATHTVMMSNGHLMTSDSCTLTNTRGIAAGGGDEKVQNQDSVEEETLREEQVEEPPKLPEKQRKNSSKNCDVVDGCVELRDK